MALIEYRQADTILPACASILIEAKYAAHNCQAADVVSRVLFRFSPAD